MSRVLLVWSTYVHPDPEVNDSVEDHWTVHESLSEAQEEYWRLMYLGSTKSVSVCGVIQSSDYSAMPEFYLG
jgi:hypothetical protein